MYNFAFLVQTKQKNERNFKCEHTLTFSAEIIYV